MEQIADTVVDFLHLPDDRTATKTTDTPTKYIYAYT